MIACFDVHYGNGSAHAAAVVCHRWEDEAPAARFTLRVEDVGAYQPGQFYKRELEPLRQLVQRIDRPLGHYVVDAYCHLDADGAPGLGARLHALLPAGSVVVGVAKNRFRDTGHAAEVYRGASRRPLFVTAVGIDYRRAASHVQSMAGAHRLPDLLKAVDRLSRNLAQ